MLILFVIESILLIAVDYVFNKRLVSVLSLFIIPYVFIFIINNTFMVNNGFNAISKENIEWHMLAFLFLFVGVSLSKLLSHKSKVDENINTFIDKACNYKIKSMIVFAVIVEIIVTTSIILIIMQNGFAYIASGENGEGLFVTGFVGHLYLSLFAITPILFFDWLKNRDKHKRIELIIYLIHLGMTFLTFTKYHSISLIMITFLLCVLEEKKYLIKGTIFLLIIIIVVFVGNYLTSFIVRNVASIVTQRFYFNHFWSYVGGSSIHANYVYAGNIIYKSDFGKKILASILPIPNMFIQGVFGIRILPDTSTAFMSIGNNNSTSNVVDAISFFYPSSNSLWARCIFLIFLVVWGWILSLVYDNTVGNERKYPLPTAVLLTFSAFLSFFGVYAVLSSPWEIFLWSIIFNYIFDRRVIINLKR